MSGRLRVAVIGAGTMGAGIAEVFAAAGDAVVLYDADVAVREAAAERAGAAPASSLEEAVANASLAIEAVPEQLELKRRVFAAVDAAAPRQAILATNTSGLSVTEIAAACARPASVLGLHFFNPVPRMRLVEVVRGRATSDDTVDRARRACEAAGKETVVVRDVPGFATTRLSALAGNEAFHMLADGVGEAEDIDRAVRLGLNHPMGPLELADLVGLDVRLNILSHLHEALGERFRPAPLLHELVGQGRLGRKTGRGIYRYDSEGRRPPPRRAPP
jgi:3-hydroxybutyryl-CoA dehydrogenase